MTRRFTRRKGLLALAVVALAEMPGRIPKALAHSACHCSRGCYFYMCKETDCVFGGPYKVCRYINQGRDAHGNVIWFKDGACFSSTNGTICDRIKRCDQNLTPPPASAC